MKITVVHQHQPGEEAEVGRAFELALAAGKLGARETGLDRLFLDAERGLATAKPGVFGMTVPPALIFSRITPTSHWVFEFRSGPALEIRAWDESMRS